VDDIHAPHRAPSIIPDPLVPVREIRLYLGVRVSHLDPLEQIGQEDGRVQPIDGEVVQGRLVVEGLLYDPRQARRGEMVEPGLRYARDRVGEVISLWSHPCLFEGARPVPTHPDLVQPESERRKDGDKDPDPG